VFVVAQKGKLIYIQPAFRESLMKIYNFALSCLIPLAYLKQYAHQYEIINYMKKVLIVGASGTGKTNLAKQLSDKLKLPVVHLDSIFWKENWAEAEEAVVKSRIQREINKNHWIIEGYIEPLSNEKMQAADLIVYLDYSGAAVLKNGIMRTFQHRKIARPEMPVGNADGIGYKFLRSHTKRDERAEIEAAIKGFERKTVRLGNKRALNKWLAELHSSL
jgi:adenylate kinase family enzyme